MVSIKEIGLDTPRSGWDFKLCDLYPDQLIEHLCLSISIHDIDLIAENLYYVEWGNA